MIGLYRRLTRGCRTQNQLNRVHIALEARMTPAEVMALWTGLMTKPKLAWFARAERRLLWRMTKMPLLRRSALSTELLLQKKLRAHSKRWISTLRERIELAGKPSPEPFVRKRVRHSVTRFDGSGDRRDKTLLVCFTGDAYRMMMPMPVFLQQIDSERVDVAYLRTVRARGYRSGIRGVGDDLESSVAALERLLDFSSYKRVAMMGSSGGGLPALFAAFQIGVDAVLAAGANNPDDPRWAGMSGGGGATALFRRFSGRGMRVPKVHLVYGALNKRDEQAAKAIASCIDVASITGVPDSDHGCLFPLVERRQFEGLLESTVLTSSMESGLP